MSISKVLIIVDNQNCFISGWSYGGHEKNDSIDLNKLANSIKQVLEISNLIDANDSIILTRYYHPINHLSIGNGKKVAINFGATHPSHCLNTKSNACPRNENLGLTNKEINSI
jgi:nicotinamidase-related amidase